MATQAAVKTTDQQGLTDEFAPAPEAEQRPEPEMTRFRVIHQCVGPWQRGCVVAQSVLEAGGKKELHRLLHEVPNAPAVLEMSPDEPEEWDDGTGTPKIIEALLLSDYRVALNLHRLHPDVYDEPEPPLDADELAAAARQMMKLRAQGRGN